MKNSANLSYEYQYNFSDKGSDMYDQLGRQRKAVTMIAVLEDYLSVPLTNLTLLNIGGSTGIIDSHLAKYVNSVVSIDIDHKAIQYASEHYTTTNLNFAVGDAMHLSFADNSFDIVICSQVYEHVPDSHKMMLEIHRVLKKGGVCYFAAGNKIMLLEPHYNLPFLSLLPKSLANLYVKLTNKGSYYYESHLTYWGLKNLTKDFTRIDYTKKIISEPEKFKINYMLASVWKKTLALYIAKYFKVLVPGYIWILEK